MAKEQKKKPASLDDVFDQLTKEHSDTISKAFKSCDEYIKEENQNHLLNNIFIKGHVDLYDSFTKELDTAFKGEKGDDTKITEKHHSKIKKAALEGLKNYFKKVQPSFLEGIKEMEESDAYEFLVGKYDEHIGAGNKGSKSKSLKGLIEEILKGKKTAGALKANLYEIGPANAKAARDLLTGRYISHHLVPHQHRLHGYIRKELEKKGMGLKKDKHSDFYNSDIDNLLQMRQSYIEKKGHPYLEEKKEK